MLSKLSVRKDEEQAGVVKRPSMIDHGALVKASMGLDSTTCTKSELVAST